MCCLNESVLDFYAMWVDKFDPIFWMLEHLPEPNSVTLKMEQPVPLKRLEETYHPTWCKNPKYCHYNTPVFSQMTVKIYFSDVFLSTTVM